MTMLSDGMLLGSGSSDYAITGIRLRGTASGPGTSWCAREIEFRNAVSYGGSKISGTPFATATEPSYPVGQAFDGNTSTFWAAPAVTPWLVSIGITCTAMRSDLKSVRWLAYQTRGPSAISIEVQKVDTSWLLIGNLSGAVVDSTWYGISDTSI